MTSQPCQSWLAFLDTVEAGLLRLAARVKAARSDPERHGYPVVRRATPGQAAPDEILIGVGAMDASPRAGICLNNKGAHLLVGREERFASLTELVLSEEPVFWEGWRERSGADTTPERALARFTLVVEDASPDSCFALLSFLARLAGVPVAQVPASWVDYIRRWEAGDVISTGLPRDSYGSLHNALAHSYFQGAWGDAWVDCLTFMVRAIRSGLAPEDLSGAPPWPELQKARAFLEFEYQTYEDSLNYATCLQLRMPMTGAEQRYKLVDAYLAVETIPLGSLKAFLRQDRTHPFLNSGFALMALYKPSETGEGNDMTVSVTPHTGIDLCDLWYRLEALEFEAWQGQRPIASARLGIIGYPDGRLPSGDPAPTEPWYDGGDYTLLGAPRRLPDGRLGSKLEWDDVCEAIWRTYHPFESLQVRSANGALVSLERCAAERFGDDRAQQAGKRLVIANWAREASAMPVLRVTPTLKRYLAACLARPETAPPIRLADLPDAADYDYLELTGGFAVISVHGAFVINDWRREPLNETDIRHEFHNACIQLAVVQRYAARVAALVNDLDAYVRGRLRRQSDSSLLNRLMAMKIDLNREWTETMAQSFDPDVRRLREALHARWGIAGRLDDFYRAVEQATAMLSSFVELRMNRRIAFLTIYGFPLVLVAAFFGFIFNDLDPHLAGGWPDWGQIHWPGLMLYVLLSALGVLAVKFFSRLQEKWSRLDEERD